MVTNPILACGRWLAEAPDNWPDAARQIAHRAFIDIVGVTLRGAAEEGPRRVFDTVEYWGGGPCAAIGMGARLAPPWAALVNGASAHVLDFDDNFEPAKAHATAVLAPAILALAEQGRASGRACLDAYIAGLQVMGRVGQGVNPVHRFRGWHATATIGAVGAAAACARLLRLDAARSAYAMSIATSMAGGFMSQFGTATKAVHAGLAAKAGVMAASFARGGIDAGLATFDGPTGMSGLMVGPDYEALRDDHSLRFETENIGDPLLILTPGLKVKRFPNCASAHRAMDGLLELEARHGFSSADVRDIVVRAPAAHLNNLIYADPQDPLQAKFSLEFALALLLVEGDCRLSHFTPETIKREDIRRLYGKIRRTPIDDPAAVTPTQIEVVLADGRSFSISVAHATGSGAAPFSLDQYWEKFEACVADVLPQRGGEQVREALELFPKLESVASLMDRLDRPVRPRSG